MKKFSLIVLSSAALALAGCDSNKGGSSDQYDNGSGADSSTNYHRSSLTNSFQGGARSPDSIDAGAGSSKYYPAVDTNTQGGATSPRTFDDGSKPIDPNSTNLVPNK